ncbi:hypothetical protein ACFWNE_17050 [Streptomyces goshikiensis]|uniref:hypothetical protein n=1 Tax=Streptomyces goshikiensis TaxID=1942 RepID=UPI003651B8D8
MTDDSSKTTDAAILGYLLSRTPLASGSVPTPAHMPRRRPRPRTAAEVEQAEGLDLGLSHRAGARAASRSTRASRPRPGKTPLDVWIFLRILGCPAGYSRPTALDLARAWRQIINDQEEFMAWSSVVGMTRPEAAEELNQHRFTPDMLQIPIEGKPARSWLRAGRDVHEVIAGLYRAGIDPRSEG